MIKVLLCSGEPISLLGLQKAFEQETDITLTSASTMESIVAEIATLNPDILIFDMTHGFSGLDVLMAVRENAKIKSILWISEITTGLAFQAMRAGVRGILRKSLPAKDCIRCVREIHTGGLWYEKELAEALLRCRQVPLSDREGELVLLTTQGLMNKEIAAVMGITEGTVKVYMSKLYIKLGVKDRLELALFGIKNLGMVVNLTNKKPLLQGYNFGLRTLALDRDI